MAWTIDYTDTARKQLRKLDRAAARRLVDYMEHEVAVLDDPRSRGKGLTGPLGGLWRYRIGDMRVICDIEDGRLCVLVLRLGNRKDVYR
ncbi:MAG: type II toxin-antitoxin system RelE family toxin [Gammaproteobacteria bacterium]